MQNIAIGDIFFIIFILCVIHGIMTLVAKLKKSPPENDEDKQGR